MKAAFFEIFTTGPVSALLAVLVLFFLTIFLVAKRWIGISTAIILLLISLAAGILINNPSLFQYSNSHLSKEIEQQDSFNKQILQAFDGMKAELQTEKDNILKLKNQVQEIIDQFENQKVKVENFISETKKHFEEEEAQAHIQAQQTPKVVLEKETI